MSKVIYGKEHIMAVDYEAIKQLALDCGFTTAGDLDVSTIVIRKEVRDACATNTCGVYGKSWACPPACGELEECSARIHAFKKGIIFQTTQELEDSFDFEGLEELGEKFGKSVIKFNKAIKEQYPGCMVLSAGTCTLCKECTYPDEPCRMPDKRLSSIEAYGMTVNEVCKANNLTYNYGPNTMTYIGCALIE